MGEAALQMNPGQSRIFQLADQLQELKERKDALKAEKTEVEKEYTRIEMELSEQMRIEEVPNFRRNGKQFITYAKLWASPQKDLKDQVYVWLKQNGYGDLVKETVNANTFNSFVNEIIEEEGDLPEDLEKMINRTEKTGVRIRKG